MFDYWFITSAEGGADVISSSFYEDFHTSIDINYCKSPDLRKAQTRWMK